MARVSVLVAAYNCAPYVAQTIDSAVQQTFQDLEVIVVDDGSTDGTRGVLERYDGHPKVKVLLQQNAGPSAAFNRARRAASGELLAVLDGDDVCWPQRIERQVQFLDAAPQVGVVGVGARLVTEGGTAFAVLNFPTDDAEIRAKMWPANDGPRSAFCGASVMARASSVEHVGGWNEAYRAAQDFDIILRLSEHFAVANLRDVLYDYRIHGAQISQTSAESKATIRYAVGAAARHRREKREVPAWCQRPPSRDELQRLGEPVDRVDEIAFENLMYTANIWAMRCGWSRAAAAASTALQVADKRQLGAQKRQRALGLTAMTRMLEGRRGEAFQLLRREPELLLGAVRQQVRGELTLRLHQLKHSNVLLAQSSRSS